MERAQEEQLKVTARASAAHAQILEVFVDILALQSAVRKSCVTDPSLLSSVVRHLYFVQLWSLRYRSPPFTSLSGGHFVSARSTDVLISLDNRRTSQGDPNRRVLQAEASSLGITPLVSPLDIARHMC